MKKYKLILLELGIKMTSKTCADCWHESNCGEEGKKRHKERCEKFKPSQGMTQEVPQNHNPLQESIHGEIGNN